MDEVVIVMVGGLPGSGKSTLATLIGQEMPAVVIRSDEVRKELAGLAHTQRGEASLYTTARSVATYAEALARARKALSAGRSVVMDATWSKAVSREPVKALAQEMGVGLLALQCRAGMAVMARRLSVRKAEGAYASDAGVAVMEAMPWDEWVEAEVVNTDVEWEEMEAIAVRVVARAREMSVGRGLSL